MCVVSMVMDHQYDEWRRRYYPPQPLVVPAAPLVPFAPLAPAVPLPTPQEVEEFRRLLDRAREYDKRHAEPDCELQEKRDRLKKLAKELGVEIDFV